MLNICRCLKRWFDCFLDHCLVLCSNAYCHTWLQISIFKPCPSFMSSGTALSKGMKHGMEAVCLSQNLAGGAYLSQRGYQKVIFKALKTVSYADHIFWHITLSTLTYLLVCPCLCLNVLSFPWACTYHLYVCIAYCQCTGTITSHPPHSLVPLLLVPLFR